MNALRPLTKICGYSASKAAVSNFTQWLAVHLAQEYSPQLRVNALAPGFFLTEQNRYLLLEKDGKALTARGRQIIEHTPIGRFGRPEDLVGTALWLVSDASRFVTGLSCRWTAAFRRTVGCEEGQRLKGERAYSVGQTWVGERKKNRPWGMTMLDS